MMCCHKACLLLSIATFSAMTALCCYLVFMALEAVTICVRKGMIVIEIELGLPILS